MPCLDRDLVSESLDCKDLHLVDWYDQLQGMNGEVPERLKGHDWKSCVGANTSTEGSNPSLSAMT